MSTAARDTILIAGASGVVGRAALEHFAARGDCRVIGISRRAPDTDVGEHLALDLTDRDACAAAAADLGDVTHVVYAALFEQPGLLAGWLDEAQMQTNLAMLRHLFEPLLAHAQGLRHVSLLQGTKAYGAHVAPMKVPGREREPRIDHPNFYWLQQDWLAEAARGASFRWTIWRPPLILGHARGAPMNVIAAIGAYAALRRAGGEPLAWPGGVAFALDAVDARLLARAFDWARDREVAAGEIFNITNGDVLVWRHAWPGIAAHLGMEAAGEEPAGLAAWLRARQDDWRELAHREGLAEPDLTRLVGDSDIYADVMVGHGLQAPPPPTFLSTIKLRQAGFGDCLDSEDAVLHWLDTLRRRRLLPG